MNESTTAYPLAWPTHAPRTLTPRRAAFKAHTIARCIGQLTAQLALLRARDVVISTNLALRLDGLPRSGQPSPRDAGAAVYCSLPFGISAVRGLVPGSYKPFVYPCDRWNTVEANLWAIAKHLEAQRSIRRWGVGLESQVFTGYAQLPAAGGSEALEWAVLMDLAPTATTEQIKARFNVLAKTAHPDHGGSQSDITRLIDARNAALAYAAAGGR